jgi:hypothetical protein
MNPPRLARIAALLPFLALMPSVSAEDHFLVLGGGYSPESNQVSLEKNVLLFQKLLGEIYPGGVPAEFYFSDGADPGRDLVFEQPVSAIPQVNLLLARVYRQADSLGETFRSHAISRLNGACNRPSLDAWFQNQGQSLKPGDRLLIYVTAHGGKGGKDTPRNTTLHLWGNQELTVKDLAAQLDSLPQSVKVVLVMVQCYAGGFADLIFQNGDDKAPLGREDLCGFFATTHDRPAAGCTTDIEEENYHEYSTYFWEAIRGRTRLDQPVTRPRDLDNDGAVSFAEAHAYTLLESRTVDIPVKTSDAFLRRFSKLQGDKLWAADTVYPDLLATANPLDRAVLEGLSQSLQLSGPNRLAAAQSKAEASRKQKQSLENQKRDLNRMLNRAATSIQRDLTARWPELKNRWNPRLVDLMTREAADVVSAITSHRSYPEFERTRQQAAQLDEQILDQDRVWVKCQRLIRTLENTAAAANLPRVADADTQARYQRLLVAEAATLATPDPAVTQRGGSH